MFCFYLFCFSLKSPCVIQRSVSQENTVKKTRTRHLLKQNYRRKYFFFDSYWNQFQVFKIDWFEFSVTVHYGLWAKRIQVLPLKYTLTLFFSCWFQSFHKMLQENMENKLCLVSFSFWLQGIVYDGLDLCPLMQPARVICERMYDE